VFIYNNWLHLMEFLTYEDIVVLMCSSKWIQTYLCEDRKVWVYIISGLQNDKYLIRERIRKEGTRQDSVGKQIIKKLIEKYVTAGARIGIQYEGVLLKTVR
jgi:hypothetical protein